ncbi:palmitoyltransferase swf1 [Agyrium rufum]|nr:palmitoyltransferase swf1 [Agyrium rufum]
MVLVPLPYYFTFRCVTSKSSTITPENHEKSMRVYPYDDVIFHPGQVCRTCQFEKPARSKHCSICKICVTKQDHHCIWVMSCLGRDNYLYFLGLLASLVMLLSWASYLAYHLLYKFVQAIVYPSPPGARKVTPWGTGKTWSEYASRMTWAFASDPCIGGIGMLTFLTAPLALGLLLYHVYLIWAGMTTNESFKWSEWKEDVVDGYVYVNEHPDAIGDSITDEHSTQVKDSIRGQRLVNLAQKAAREDRQTLEAIQATVSRPPWRLIHDMGEINNIYDYGFLGNIKDVLNWI